VYTDFQKVFDKVHYVKLLHKLSHLGFSERLLHLLTSDLHERTHNLGPYFFLLFVLDLAQCLRYSHALLYANDLKLYNEIKTISDVELLQADLDALQYWSEENLLSLNVVKCIKMTFTLRATPTEASYVLHGTPLQEVTPVWDLGVQLDRKLIYRTTFRV